MKDPKIQKNCERCSVPFTTRNIERTYCSEKCTIWNEKKKIHYKKIYQEKRVKLQYIRVCNVCTNNFKTFYKIKIFCSRACRDKKYRLKLIKEIFRLSPEDKQLREKILSNEKLV